MKDKKIESRPLQTDLTLEELAAAVKYLGKHHRPTTNWIAHRVTPECVREGVHRIEDCTMPKDVLDSLR